MDGGATVASEPIRAEPAAPAPDAAGESAPVTVVHRRPGHRSAVRDGSLRVLTYDRARGVASLSERRTRTHGGSAAHRVPATHRGPAAHGGSASAAAVEPGDVVASAPTAAQPDGALFTVTSVRRTTSGYQVTTGPVTLDQVLGAATVRRTLEGSDLNVSVTTIEGRAHVMPASTAIPSHAGARPVAFGSAAAGQSGLPVGSVARPASRPGGVLLSLNAPSSLTGMTDSINHPYEMAGWVGLTPKLIFSYSGSSTGPSQAALGIGGTYDYGWLVHATMPVGLSSGVMPLRIPFATVHLGTVVWVGPVPVVITADIGLFYKISAHGDLSIDAEQRTLGRFTLAGQYTSTSGWTPVKSDASTSVRGGHEAVLGTAGRFRAVFGTEVAVLLYGVVGLSGTVGPYLQVTAPVQASALATTPWTMSGGIQIVGALTARLGLFGFTVLRVDVPLGTLDRSWPIASGTVSTSRYAA